MLKYNSDSGFIKVCCNGCKNITYAALEPISRLSTVMFAASTIKYIDVNKTRVTINCGNCRADDKNQRQRI